MLQKVDTRKAQEGDVVELLEDYPKYGLRRGQRGVVITAFNEPSEAYDLEIEDEQGNFSGFAYSVKPEHITNLSGEALDRGLRHLDDADLVSAWKEFKRAINLRPEYLGTVHNLVLRSFAGTKDWTAAIFYLRFVVQLNPLYEVARDNLAIAYLNWGVEVAGKGDQFTAMLLFNRALAVESSPDVSSKVRENFAASYHQLGIQAHVTGNLENALGFMRIACNIFPDAGRRRNLSIACASMALTLIEQRQYEAAISAFEEAEDAGLVRPELLNDYALALLLSGKFEQARLALERALELEPQSEIIAHNLIALASGGANAKFIPEKFEAEYVHIPPPVPQAFHVGA